MRMPIAPARQARIGVLAASGQVDPERLRDGIGKLEAAGHRVVVAPDSLVAWRYFADTDAARAAALQRLIDDPAVDIVIAARGGYGISRILNVIDWERVGKSGKVFVGFSDFTAFNCAALARAGLGTLHGPMVCADFGDGDPDAFMARHFDATVFGPEDSVSVEGEHGLAQGNVRGTLWGGNLSLLTHLAGTPYLPDIEGGILYVEEIAEEPYAVERMFLQLHHAGILKNQRAVLLGDFAGCVPRNPARYPYAMAEVIETLRGLLDVPVLEGLPFGHVARKLTLPFGLEGTLRLVPGAWTLRWPGLGRT